MNVSAENPMIRQHDSCPTLILMPVCLEKPQILKNVCLQTYVEVTQVEKSVTVHTGVQDVVGKQGCVHSHTPDEVLEALPTLLQKSDSDFYFQNDGNPKLLLSFSPVSLHTAEVRRSGCLTCEVTQ